LLTDLRQMYIAGAGCGSALLPDLYRSFSFGILRSCNVYEANNLLVRDSAVAVFP